MSESPSFDLMAWASEYGATGKALSPDVETALRQITPQQLCTDTRELKAGDIYVPLKGEHFDGHHFIEQAFEAGAVLALCAADAPLETQRPVLRVDDTLKAFQDLARQWRRQCNVTVIGITGSSGKTSTKEILKQIFARDFKVHATPLNWNNEIGVPRTLLGLTPEHEVCLVEMGMRGEGQIQELCVIAEPDYGVITNIGPVHMSELGSQEAITRTKWELADWVMQYEGSRLVINTENSILKEQYQALPPDERSQVITISRDPQSTYSLLSLSASGHSQTPTQRIVYRTPQQEECALTLDLLGEHQALNALCGVALLHLLGHQLEKDSHIEVPRLSGRQENTTLATGAVLINDAYNANPDSMRAALNVLNQLRAPRLAVLGFMGELGPDSERYHRELGAFCQELNLAALVVVGDNARGILEGFGHSGIFCEDIPEAASALEALLRAHPQARVLIKASRSVALERVIEHLEPLK